METDPLLPRHNQLRNESTLRRRKFKYLKFFSLFRYSEWIDIVLMLIGSLCAMIHGAALPMLSIIFGKMTNTLLFQTLTTSPRHNFTSLANNSSIIEESALNFSHSMINYSLYYAYICIGVMFAAFMQTYCWELACERQVYKLRKNFFSQILRQDISWYDCNKGGDLTVKLSDDLERVREGIGNKCSNVIQYISTFVSGIAVGLIVSLNLTVVVLIFGPFVIGTTAYTAKIVATSSAREQAKYALAGQVAEQVLINMRTVVAFGKQEQEIKRFEKALELGRLVARKKYCMLAFCVAIVNLINYLGYGFTFWYGSKLIAEGEATAGSLFTVFFSVMSGAFSLGNAMPYVAVISIAIGAASTLFDIIDRIPQIDSSSGYGQKPHSARGDIELRNISFSYPARETVKVLESINLKIKAGQKVGIVGASGSGKSTIVSLLLRMYDPTSGQILLNGTDLRDLNVQWLRKQIGVVTQEPVLFGTTIYENICYGSSEVIEDRDIIRAATDANAHSFISKLPNGYHTTIGGCVGGAQISGGEKQRIAIARALVRNPSILILDEATSALDYSSENVVQQAIDKASEGRTTIIIAHRLSTVYKADCIYVLRDGVVVEQGNHSELMQQKGHYFHLVEAQTSDTKDENRHDNRSFTMLDVNKNSIENKPKYKGSTSTGSIEEMAMVLDEILKPNVEKSPMIRLLKLNIPEWKSLCLGLLFCSCSGAIMPFFSIFYGEAFDTYTLPNSDIMMRAEFWTFMFLVLAIMAGLVYLLQIIAMTSASEHLVKRVRVLAFSNILQQPVSWLDQDEFSPSKLCTRLARDAPMIKSAAGLRAGQVISATVTMLSALCIAFIFGWKLALVLTLAMPLLIFASYQLTLVSRRYQNRDGQLMDKAGKVASESIQNIRTVKALGREHTFLSLYMENLEAPLIEAKKQALIFACVVAFCQAVIYAMYSGAFRWGAYLVEKQEMDVVDVFRVFFAMAFSAQSIGQTTAYLQDYSKARISAENLFQIMDHSPDIVDGTKKPKIMGKINFNAVHFWYPSRPTIPVLKGLSLHVEKGRTLALVGTSGSGKSTIVALLERFYEPVSGQIMIDGNDIRDINLAHLRNYIGLVTQEPILFDCSLKDNIAYGSKKEVSMDDVINAAKAANIHDFIMSLPQGYETPAGNTTGQSQLSGGQKQRIAIARALVRDPRILLLDEATSALDATSEKEVQAALDKACEGRTCIIIAHRLSTIRNADLIAVIHKGQIVEQGPHDYLMRLRGRYYQLLNHQGL